MRGRDYLCRVVGLQKKFILRVLLLSGLALGATGCPGPGDPELTGPARFLFDGLESPALQCEPGVVEMCVGSNACSPGTRRCKPSGEWGNCVGPANPGIQIAYDAVDIVVLLDTSASNLAFLPRIQRALARFAQDLPERAYARIALVAMGYDASKNCTRVQDFLKPKVFTQTIAQFDAGAVRFGRSATLDCAADARDRLGLSFAPQAKRMWISFTDSAARSDWKPALRAEELGAMLVQDSAVYVQFTLPQNQESYEPLVNATGGIAYPLWGTEEMLGKRLYQSFTDVVCR